MLPPNLAITYTIPDVRASKWRDYWVLTIAMVVAWLAVISVLVVLAADQFGCLAGIESDVVGPPSPPPRILYHPPTFLYCPFFLLFLIFFFLLFLVLQIP